MKILSTVMSRLTPWHTIFHPAARVLFLTSVLIYLCNRLLIGIAHIFWELRLKARYWTSESFAATIWSWSLSPWCRSSLALSQAVRRRGGCGQPGGRAWSVQSRGKWCFSSSAGSRAGALLPFGLGGGGIPRKSLPSRQRADSDSPARCCRCRQRADPFRCGVTGESTGEHPGARGGGGLSRPAPSQLLAKRVHSRRSWVWGCKPQRLNHLPV